MTSPLPPRLRDTRSLADRVRQDRQNLESRGVGYIGGRFAPAKPLGATAQLGDIEDDSGDTDATPMAFHNSDRKTATGPGTVTFPLTYVPIEESVHVRWNGLDQPPTEWTISGSTVTIPDPSGLISSGDVFTAAYAYWPDDQEEPLGGTLLAFNSPDWKWKQVDRTDATDYSSPDFDDATWATASASFGDGGDMADDTGGAHTTLWQQGTRMWARRTLTNVSPDTDIQATIRADFSLVLWLDGVQVYSGDPNGTQLTVTIPGSSVSAESLVLAARVTDEATTYGCFFDLELVQ